VVFGVDINVDVEDFLNSCDFVRTTQAIQSNVYLFLFYIHTNCKKNNGAYLRTIMCIFEYVQCVEVATCVPYCIFIINISKWNNM
jgi:hypothetical protein